MPGRIDVTMEAPAEASLTAGEPPGPHVPLPPLSEELLRLTRSGGPTWDDSRRHPRFSVAAEGHLQVDRPHEASGQEIPSQTVLLRDLSRSGLRFLHGAILSPGDLTTIRLANGARLPLRVVWCRRLESGLFMSGCRFNGKPATVGEEGEITRLDAAD